ncbi:hypothetical protein QQ054_29390 [Oscillatoria amoena NRMC-F 0135]|nr:hypothetical protein [Oscillatoria amoena NRMC-F 0135]
MKTLLAIAFLLSTLVAFAQKARPVDLETVATKHAVASFKEFYDLLSLPMMLTSRKTLKKMCNGARLPLRNGGSKPNVYQHPLFPCCWPGAA